jgi:hypothetical protein
MVCGPGEKMLGCLYTGSPSADKIEPASGSTLVGTSVAIVRVRRSFSNA